jgi:hypothetical protein
MELRRADHEGDVPGLLYVQFTHGSLLSCLIGCCSLPHRLDVRPITTADRRLIPLIKQRYGIWHLSMTGVGPSYAGMEKVHALRGEEIYHLLISDVVLREHPGGRCC